MAVKKPTTTDDLRNEQQVANDGQLQSVSDLTDPAVVAKVDGPKTVKVKSPTGAVSEVPEGIVDALLDSGYRKSK